MKIKILIFFVLYCFVFSACKKDSQPTSSNKYRLTRLTSVPEKRTVYEYNGNNVSKIIETRGDINLHKYVWNYEGDNLSIDIYNGAEMYNWTLIRKLIITYDANRKLSSSHYEFDNQAYQEQKYTWDGDLLHRVDTYSTDTISSHIEYFYSGTQLDSTVFFNGLGNRLNCYQYTYLNGKLAHIYDENKKHKITAEYSQEKLSKVSVYLIMDSGEENLLMFEDWVYDDKNNKITHSTSFTIEYEKGESNLKDYDIVTGGWPWVYLTDEINQSAYIK